MAELNRQREEARLAMTPQERWQAANPYIRRGRPATMTPEERKERQRERARIYQRERRERQRQA